jgi:carbon storage regulator
MLVLSRKTGERIWIGDEIAITVVRVNGGGVRIGIEAPPHLPVMRDELKQKMLRSQTESVVDETAWPIAGDSA